MHDTALSIGCLAIELYCAPSGAILELGSMDVNGSLRQCAPKTARYVGVDLEAGPGVDVVTTPSSPLPVEDASFDLVAASSVLEHDPFFWQTFVDMCRKAKPGGVVYINAPSNGVFHRYPEDHWRFYPDSGKALVRWAVSQGQDVTLIESFVAPRQADIWNDFVAVFRKGPSRKRPPKQMLHSLVPGSMNIQIGLYADIVNHVTISEDMLLIEQARNDAQQYNDISVALENSISQMQLEIDRAAQAEAAAWAEVDVYKDNLAQMEAALRQRQEEIEQLSRAEAEVRSQLEHSNAQLRSELDLALHAGEEACVQLASYQAQLAELEDTIRQRQQEIEQITRSEAEVRAQLEHSMSEMQAEIARAAEAEIEVRAQIEAYKGDLAQLESAFRQSREEIEQTSRAEAEARSQAAALGEQVGNLTTRLAAEEAWTFRLAGERRVADEAATRAEQAMEAALFNLERVSAQLAARDQSLERARTELSAERAKSHEFEKTSKHKSAEATNEIRDRRAIALALEQARAELDRETQAGRAAAAFLKDAHRQIDRQSTENALLVERVALLEEDIARERTNIAWLRDVYTAQGENVWWWRYVPESWRVANFKKRLANQRLFDVVRYLELHPDVAAHGMDPLHHYIFFGMAERRRT